MCRKKRKKETWEIKRKEMKKVKVNPQEQFPKTGNLSRVKQ